MRTLDDTEIETPETTASSPFLRTGDLAAGAATSQLLLPAPTRVPPWREQLTFRGVAVAAALGTLLCVVIHRLNLTVGVIPALNVASGLLSYFLTTAWRAAAGRLGFGRGSPFTRQENTVIQTCAIACAGLAFSGCSASYIFAMDRKTYELVGPDYPGNRAEDVKDPSLGWMIGFLFLIALLGPFAIVILRKVLVIDYKLAFPGGTATALMINSLHGEKEADLTGKKVHCLVKYMGLSFGWSFFKWFFSGVGDSCGFDNFPTFGPEAFKNTFYFDFNPSYVGYGLISPHIVNCSVFLGSVISWGFLWPFITTQAGDWYPDNLSSNDFRGLYGYKVFVAISIILGDGLYNLVKIFVIIAREIWNMQSKQRDQLVQPLQDNESSKPLMDDTLQTEMFFKDSIPTSFAVSGYILLAAISTAVVPSIFPQLKWYLVLACYFLAPAVAFCNSYGMGLTNLNLAPTYGKIALFLFASLVGSNNGGVIAGLAACGIIMSIACSAADLMQDFKCGYLTLSSPRSMFVSQLAGVALGCVIAPLTLWLFWAAFDIGNPDGEYKAPFAIIFREMAILGVEGFGALPKHCLQICCAFFLASLAINLLRDITPASASRFIPIPMAMAVPFYIGAFFGVDMFVGTVILFAWQKVNRRDANDYAVAAASGLICGDGIWSIPSAVLSILKIDPPVCMSFRPSSASSNRNSHRNTEVEQSIERKEGRRRWVPSIMEMLSMLKVGYTVLRSETPATDLVNTFMDWAARRSLLLLAVFMPPYYVYKLTSSALATVAPEDVAGKVVLITGASSGIGEQIAYQYAKKGARLALVARREGSLHEVAAKAMDLGSPDVLVVPGDVARPEDCKAFVQATVERFGGLDHLVNNAGLANVCWFEEVPNVADLKQVLDVNFWGTVHPTHAALPHLKNSGGKIFVNSSAAAMLAMPRMSFYNASKAAVLNFAETLRMELGGEVGVTVATPGWIESEMTKGKHLSSQGRLEVGQDTRDAQVGLLPVVRAERCAEAIVDAVCRGRRSVTVPVWYRALFLWRAFAPEVGDMVQRVFYRRTAGDGGSQMRARRVMELTGAKRVLQPPSLYTSDIKRE